MFVLVNQGTGQVHTFSFDSDGFEDGEAQCACLHDVKKCSAMLLDDAEKRTLVLSSGNSQLHEVDLERGCVVRQLGMPECVTAITYGAHVPRPEMRETANYTQRATVKQYINLVSRSCAGFMYLRETVVLSSLFSYL
ncbi:hypothetical protein ERJ75_000754700 [Trypanosoma vivax]|nr:hypothetical protein TRVL_04775 [Trypanosoma vivax]KAH8613970.1 hypothetical protein ERJ75_000754700 [Trypanosoma vivax]